MALTRLPICLMLLSAAAAAATPGLTLGLDYTETEPLTGQIATDNSGAFYVLSSCVTGSSYYYYPSCVTKMSADGKTIVWQTNLGFTAAMAVDPNGGVYVVPEPPPELGIGLAPFNVFVEKLSADGSSVLWRTPAGAMAANDLGAGYGVLIAVDSTGRAFVSTLGANGAYVVRLNAAGAVDFTSALNLPNAPAALAVDPAGSHVVVALEPTTAVEPWGYARLAPNGAIWTTFTPPYAIPLQSPPPGLAVAANGDALVYGNDFSGNVYLQRLDPSGAVVFATAIPTSPNGGVFSSGGLALDTAGNAYVTGYSGALMHAVRNSLAPCGEAWLSVYAPDGTLLQSTYLPDAISSGQVVVSPDSNVFVLTTVGGSIAPTQTAPFPGYPFSGPQYGPALFHLSPNASARILPLACVGNAASFATGPVAPGEMATLFGSGLGPQLGVQTTATLANPYPTQAGNVEVTFDGTPAPLLWVQDAQINLAVPWSVAGPNTKVCVTYNNVQSNCLSLPVAQAAPGVFTLDGTYAAALNQDGSINSAANPAPPDSIVAIFATGLGPINPPQSDGSLVGLPLPVNTLSLMLEAQQCPSTGCLQRVSTLNPLYAGPAPYLISGTSQINFAAGGASAARLFLEVVGAETRQTGNTFRIHVASQ